MIQNKTIHYWKLGRDELLLARRNPEIQEIKDHQKETKTWRGWGNSFRSTISTTLTTTNIYYFYFIILTSQMCK